MTMMTTDNVEPQSAHVDEAGSSEETRHAHLHKPHVREELHEVREELHERAQEPTSVHGHAMTRGTVVKFIGLLVFIGIMVLVMVLLWPVIVDTFAGGEDLTVLQRARLFADRMQSAGPAGIPILFALQLVQVVVASIPGELVQLVAGLMYGPILGTIIIFVGCVVSTAIVYKLVHSLGAPFVQSMVSTEHLEKFRHFEESGKLDIVVFVLFLIPGVPKDVITYLVPLTNMPGKRFIALANVARIPGIVASTYVASGLANERYISSIVVVVLVVILAVLGFFLRDKIAARFGGHKRKDAADDAASSGLPVEERDE